MKKGTKGVLITIFVIVLLLGVGTLGVASKGFTNFDVTTWKATIEGWASKFNTQDTKQEITAISLFIGF